MSVTLSPFRLARRSLGGLGSSSDGGNGGPVCAQPKSKAQRADTTPSLHVAAFIETKRVSEDASEEWEVRGTVAVLIVKMGFLTLCQLSLMRRGPPRLHNE